MRYIKRKRKYHFLFAAILSLYSAYILLDAFVVPRDLVTVEEAFAASQDENTFSEQNTAAMTAEKSGQDDTTENIFQTDTQTATENVSETDTSTGNLTETDAGTKNLTEADADADTLTNTESSAGSAAGAGTQTGTESSAAAASSIELTEITAYDTQVYIADIYLSDPSELMTAVANGTFGRNVTEKTSEIAEENNAVLAVNGDFYGFRDSGYVMRNGYLYRDTARKGSGNEDLVIYGDGTMEIIDESEVTAQELVEKGAVQIFSFGPGLIADGVISVDENTEVDQSMRSNPRTAIGMIEPGHYVMVVSDGRTEESEGLTLYELASVMKDLGCTVAYNLDGGGSSTMYYNGEIVNNPTTNGNRIKERKVSDIVYIAA